MSTLRSTPIRATRARRRQDDERDRARVRRQRRASFATRISSSPVRFALDRDDLEIKHFVPAPA